MIFGMGPMELALILLVVLVIFGPKNLPKLGSALGKTVKSVREGMEGEDPDDASVEAPADDPGQQQ
ncbi:twin-arginine translocase TatA/TatE family subunit [Olsenella sp. DSM 107455]|uniref:Sec-independent protein translocase protein TatA n=1 Tax=Thermophilibacter gallinarum TaxID=2779357 RepID=A0ABR9QS32_9ACTN|nr:twin-arginine translocase TatA/TatE family subunit [Thermophilibacter gallinarum]MBE5023847.1 twin-arginine translocase TatA/TatE family subunit [Thermophilibacter gallinarum]